MLICVQLFCDAMDCSLPGYSVHGLTQARILEWVAISFSRRSFWPKILYHRVTREAKNCNYWIKKKACVNFCCVLPKFFSEDCIDFHYNEWICLFVFGPMERKDCGVFKLLSVYWLKTDILMLFSFESSKSEFEHILISLVQLLSYCLTLCIPRDCSPPRPPCPSPTPGTCSNSCPSSPWCHPTISTSVVPFSSHLQSFPASGSFQMSQLLATGGQSIGVSASS